MRPDRVPRAGFGLSGWIFLQRIGAKTGAMKSNGIIRLDRRV
jgi:hypothetical protein